MLDVMKTHPRLTGLCLLLISIGFFYVIDLDKGGSILELCGFLLFFVCGSLVLVLFWNDGDISELRRIHKERNDDRPFQIMPVQRRTFRYPPMRGARLAVMRSLYLFMAALALAALYVIISTQGKAETAAMETLYFVFGLFASCSMFFYWLTWRYARLFITIDREGITAFTIFGLRHIGWEEIVAVRDFIPFRGLVLWLSDFFAADFTLYKIYTRNHMITFSSSIPGADELLKVIKMHTGLPDI
jgi:hypothetical protein